MLPEHPLAVLEGLRVACLFGRLRAAGCHPAGGVEPAGVGGGELTQAVTGSAQREFCKLRLMCLLDQSL